MRESKKKQLIEIINSMKELHMVFINMKEMEKRYNFLEECQQAAIAIGETVEKEIPDDNKIVPQLETYCEEIYLLSQKEVLTEESIQISNRIIDSVRTFLIEIPVTYHVVFLPYKASMWDSLESIWRACKDDNRCECFVIPIPYYQFDAKKNTWEYCYEGDRFPSEIPITHYQEYLLQKNQPDIVYIHNPYNQYNRVTSVHPDYYSNNLKKYVGKLVYVPYYVTPGLISPELINLPSYEYMDFIIVQSEYTRSKFQDSPYYNKLLPLGSPKIDRIIKACQKEAVMPSNWQPVFQDKRVVMLNTSLGCFLQGGEVYLKKIKYLCKILKGQNKVVLIWRPHPLLESTIKAMCPHLLSKYQGLLSFFRDNQIGILDETPDITSTVALADAYIGEEGSSVISLFQAAGKPIYILNNHITEDFTEEERRRFLLGDIAEGEGKLWLTAMFCNALFEVDRNTHKIYFAGKVEGQTKWSGAYSNLTSIGEQLFLSPNFADCPVAYHIKKQQFEVLSQSLEEKLRCWKVVSYKNKVFYLPAVNNSIIEYDIIKKQWKYHTQCIQEFSRKFVNQELVTWSYAKTNETLWITAAYTNCVLQFNMDNGFYRIHSIGEETNGYSGIVADKEGLWLAEVHTGKIIKWSRYKEMVQIYDMPKEFYYWQQFNGRSFVHSYLLDLGEWVISIPGFSNSMIKLDKVSGKVTMLCSEFWDKTPKEANGYHPQFLFSSLFGAKISSKCIWVQRNSDLAVAEVNVEEETYEIFYPELSKVEFDKLLEGEDGFEQREKGYGFFRKEDRLFPFQKFIEDLVEDRLKAVQIRQTKELSDMTTNRDGTCGMKIHEYMMKVLSEKQTNKSTGR